MTGNTNCLENIQCPECGNESRFKISAFVIADVSDDGAEFHGDCEWDEDSPIHCPQCDHSGTVSEFRSPVFNVHIYREMRLLYKGVHAPSHEAAAECADDMPTSAASVIEDCDGSSMSALVDVVGDDEFTKSRTIDFELGRRLKAYEQLAAALEIIASDAEACSCRSRSWYGEAHDTQCPIRIARDALAIVTPK